MVCNLQIIMKMNNTMKRILFLLAATLSSIALEAQEIELQWIGNSPEMTVGQSWGIPFPIGQVQEGQQAVLTDGAGQVLPLQQWVMARHRDGSVKWLGLASTIAPENALGLKVTMQPLTKKKARMKADTTPVAGNVKVQEEDDEILIENGAETIRFAKKGARLINSIEMGGAEVAGDGKLVCITEDISKESGGVIHFHDFQSNLENVTVEKNGPVLAVVKMEGKHSDGKRDWLPFVVRFYVYSDVPGIRMVHSIIYDGEQRQDFIKGLGVEFSVPFREEIHNRHIRFAGQDGGLWSEAVQPLYGGRVLTYPGIPNVFEAQSNGERIPNYADFADNPKGQKYMRDWVSWSDYRLTQLTPDGFEIRKRTNDQSCWVGTAGDSKAEGYVLAGDLTGGLGLSLKDFWQSYPTELEVRDMVKERAKMTVWMWSPRAEKMDMRHYDLITHDLDSSYEDYQEGLDTPFGVAKTSEITIIPYRELPSKSASSANSAHAQAICQLMATPKYLHDAGAFGKWSLPDTNGGQVKQWIEKQFDDYIDYYKKAVETERWYGFWNYGDFIRTYAPERHSWDYDSGGLAWQNTELETDLWLWYAFLRTGREDIFRLAAAMTRHTSEVDMYHIGDYKGLGTRHNVSHWGCGAKEARIGQAWWKRYFYYLTTDDRVGDVMHEAIYADYATVFLDPLRIAMPRDEYPTAQPTRVRWAPDWMSFVGSWYTEWERTGDKQWLDKIEAGMNVLSSQPYGLFRGKNHAPYGYDPATGVLVYEGDPSWAPATNYLANIQGSFETMMEIWDGIGNEAFNKTYLDYCSWYSVPRNDALREKPENAAFKDMIGDWKQHRMLSFAGYVLQDKYRMKLAWTTFLSRYLDADGNLQDLLYTRPVTSPDALIPFEENPKVNTCDASQWNLEVISMLEMAGDYIPSLDEVKSYKR